MSATARGGSDPRSARSPRDWIAAVSDPGSIGPVSTALDAPRASPHLTRWRMPAQDDDGVVLARATVHGLRALVAAQDGLFIGGSVGVSHARALRELFAVAQRERPAALVLLLASGGVRLHEANPAEIELAAALAGLLDVRAGGTPVVALAIGDVFGGASVLACAADRLAMLPGTRLGVSGPKVIATHAGASAAEAPSDVFTAERRSAAGQVDLVAPTSDAVRAWIVSAARAITPFAQDVERRQHALGRPCTTPARAAAPLPEAWRARADALAGGDAVWRLRDRSAWIVAPRGPEPLGPGDLHAIDEALLGHVLPAGQAGSTLVLIEDAAGHEASLAAEALCLSRYLAHHAAVLARLRQRGVRVVGVLAGTGAGAAFFANALQAPELYALRGARMLALPPAAVARVTGVSEEELARFVSDPVLGHDIDALAHWGRLRGRFDVLDAAALESLLR